METLTFEAESIAYIVCSHFGLDTSEYSFTYIASWCESQNMKTLKASMDTIRKTSAGIIENIETKMHELEMERPIRETFHREDVILHLSGSMGSEYAYDLVENMTAEQLQENVKEYVSRLEQKEISEDEKSLEEFLEDRGAVITVLYASDGVGGNYPIHFFDAAYDADTGSAYFSGCLKDWLVEVSEESDIDSDVITARSLLSRLEKAETLSIFTRQPEQEQSEATITFYVAECMEFPVMGEYHNNLTLEEAIKIYESIPAERMHGGKGIGFDLQDGDEDYSGEYELMSWDRVDRELIDMIPHYKESPLVQKAINDMEKYLADKKNKQAEITEELSEKQSGKNIDVEKNAEKKVTREPGSIKKSVLQSLKDYQARVKAQEKAQEKNNEHKKGDMEL